MISNQNSALSNFFVPPPFSQGKGKENLEVHFNNMEVKQ